MNRTPRLMVGLGAAAVLVAGGIAAAVPALAQTDPEPAGGQCPYECPLDRDQIREQARDRTHHQLRDPAEYGPGEGRGYGSGDGTCRLTPDPTE